MMRVILLAAILVASLGAAAPVSSENQLPREPSREAQKACALRHGSIEHGGCMVAGGWECIIKYADAGRPCTDKSQCEGRCWVRVDGAGHAPKEGEADSGVCEDDSRGCGCYALIMNGRAQPWVCDD